ERGERLDADAWGQVDGGHGRWVAVGAFRAYDRGAERGVAGTDAITSVRGSTESSVRGRGANEFATANISPLTVVNLGQSMTVKASMLSAISATPEMRFSGAIATGRP